MNFRQFKSDVSSNIVVSSGVRGNTICDPSDSCNCDPSDTCITDLWGINSNSKLCFTSGDYPTQWWWGDVR